MTSPERPVLPFVALLLFMVPALAFAEWDVDGLEELLPHHETLRERLVWQGREDEMPGRQITSDPPPSAPISTMTTRQGSEKA